MENKNKSKKLNTGDVIVVAFGAMIGWGWVVSSIQLERVRHQCGQPNVNLRQVPAQVNE